MLITITLLAFLVLLLVSLASLTRVETQVAANNTQLAQARANALFALNLAVGQLQKYAGPDQAVTARADIDTAVQAQITAKQPCNPLWTGVWDATSRDSSNVELAIPTHNPVTAPPPVGPMVWLVSGNEANGTGLTPDKAPVVDPETDSNNVWLVRKVLGEELKSNADYPLDGRVKLAKSLIQVPAGQLPGFDSTSTTATPVGAYAWWVGDEGIKAKINLPDPYRSAASSAPETAWRRSAAPRPGLEMLTANALKTAFTATTDVFELTRTKLLAYQQLPLLDANLATTGIAEAGRYSSDLTTVGYGVLADTLRGGLRRDLTRGLAATPTAGSTAAAEIGDAVEVFTLPAPGPYGRTARAPANAVWTPSTLSDGGTKNGEPLAPTWSEVRAWAAIRAPAGGGAIDPRGAGLVNTTRVVNGNSITCPTTTGHAILPVVTMLELGYGLEVDDATRSYRIMVRPVLVLMNPYNVALNTATYSVIYQPTVTSDCLLSFTLAQGSNSNTPPDYSLLSYGTPLIANNPINNTGQLSLNVTDSFGPGEIRVYSMPASGDFQVNNGVFNLTPGLSTNKAYLATGTQVPSWYDPALRDSTTITWSKVPVDHPRISLALGKTDTTTVATASIINRYIQTASSYIFGLNAKPNPTAKLGTGVSSPARQMRTLRYTLRHANFNLLANLNSNMPTQGETGTAPSDTTSGARFLVDSNPRAIVSQRLGGRDDVAHYAVQVLKGSGYSDIDYDVSGGATLGYWGGSSDDSAGSTRAILFDVLRQNEEIVSLGRLGQVNWGVDGKHPAYPLGNSFASVFYMANTPDYGYALNEALWDRFFLSTLPASLSTRPANLPDSRLKFHDPAGASANLASLEGMNGYQLAATRLMIDGAFNINSTSVEAWAAFLGSVQSADYAYQSSAGARTDTAVRAFPRVVGLHDPDPAAPGQSGNMYEWTGYRQLSEIQLRDLATEIVTGIKARGRPARSLGEFMNRDLSQAAASSRNQAGIVQAAIDAKVNGNLSGLSGLNTAKIVPAAFSIADNPDAARGKLRSTGAPGFLLQSDLLAPLAPAMSARSDTFRVRTYGEARNPATGDISGRAWCEAVVQRLPEFVGGESAELRLNDPALGSGSKTFGRKFVIVQFRWLGPDEI